MSAPVAKDVAKLGPMSAIGLGTWPLTGQACVDAVRSAIDVGYTHIDTAQAYDNEAEVGRAVAASGERGRLFVTTKLPPDRLRPEQVSAALDESLERLGLDYVDLLLIHWPNPVVPIGETLAAMAAARAAGKTRLVGLSNFTSRLLAEAVATGVSLFCNQVEFHPFLDQSVIHGATRRAGLYLVGYSPLARGKGGEPAAIARIAERHGKTAAQVTLRWALQHDGVGVVVKAASRERQRENLSVFDFELDAAEMADISGLSTGLRLVNPRSAPVWD